MSDAQHPLVLVDGSSYLFRAFHALPPLTTSDGQPTGAIRGVVNMLRRLRQSYPESPFAVIFDAPGKTFRSDLYPEYKAHRPPMDPDLRAQIAPLHQVIRAYGFPLIMVPEVEADDVIGTLATQAAAQRPVVISTSDKDLAQLVTGQVTLVNTMTDTTLDQAGVREKFGVDPEQIIDLLALTGDSVDNIPGIPKVGPKTAAKWLNQFGSLDHVMARAEEVTGKIGESLRSHLDQLPLSRTLATIKCDVVLEQGPEDLWPTAPDEGVLKDWFQRLEFKAELRALQGKGDEGTSARGAGAEAAGEGTAGHPGAAEPAQAEPGRYEIILDEAGLQRWLKRLEDVPCFAFDTETTSLAYMAAELVGVSFAVTRGEAAYVPFGHRYLGAPAQLSQGQVLEALRPLLEDPAKLKIGQNLKYDASVLARAGIALRGIAYDTMLESYVLDAVGGRHNMDDLALRLLGYHTTAFEAVAGKGKDQLTFDQVSLEQAGPYAAEDADIAFRLHEALWPRLAQTPSLLSVYETLEAPLVPVLSRIERNGALIDTARLRAQSAEIAEALVGLEAQAHELAGGPFNLASTKQLQEVLYEKLELPVLKKTPKGAPSTAEPVLAELAHDYPLPAVIMRYRTLAKLKSTYTDTLPQQVNPGTGRIHTSYHQAVTATGRLSSSEPNLQNIPIRTEEGRRVRQAFIAPPGHRLLAADYSQIELRIMAHLSEDPSLCKAFAEDRDVHQATAAEVFDVALEAVTGEQRRRAKAINFGLIYGMSAFGLARQLGLERGEAQGYIDRYFERYPGVKAYMDRTRALAAEQGYVETLFGRRLYLPEIRVQNQQRRQAAERTAINAPMQGTAADIIKRAMIAVDRWLLAEPEAASMIMQVHDELVFEVPEGAVDAVAAEVRRHMEGAAALRVPLKVDVGVGANWDEAH
jgi:DNA polymerase-1